MSRIKTFFAFIFGVAIGGCGTWYYLKETYDRRSEQDISSTKEAFHSHEEKLKAEILKLQNQLQKEQTTAVPQTIISNGNFRDKGNVVEYAMGKYQQYAKSVDEADSKTNSIETPYVISPDEFGEIDGYAQVSLTYYADGILADENGVIIDEIEEIVGDALEHFGEYEDDSVFCRSDPKKCDYEILNDLRRYADVRKSFPPNI